MALKSEQSWSMVVKNILFLIKYLDESSISAPHRLYVSMSKLFNPYESWFTQLSYEDSKDLLA